MERLVNISSLINDSSKLIIPKFYWVALGCMKKKFNINNDIENADVVLVKSYLEIEERFITKKYFIIISSRSRIKMLPKNISIIPIRHLVVHSIITINNLYEKINYKGGDNE